MEKKLSVGNQLHLFRIAYPLQRLEINFLKKINYYSLQVRNLNIKVVRLHESRFFKNWFYYCILPITLCYSFILRILLTGLAWFYQHVVTVSTHHLRPFFIHRYIYLMHVFYFFSLLLFFNLIVCVILINTNYILKNMLQRHFVRCLEYKVHRSGHNDKKYNALILQVSFLFLKVQ